jgi:hypothetical protein
VKHYPNFQTTPRTNPAFVPGNTIEMRGTVDRMKSQLTQRGLSPGKRFRQVCSSMRSTAIARDLEIIRREAFAARRPFMVALDNHD